MHLFSLDIYIYFFTLLCLNLKTKTFKILHLLPVVLTRLFVLMCFMLAILRNGPGLQSGPLTRERSGCR